MTNKKVIFQSDAMDCGSTCLAIVAGHYGRHPDPGKEAGDFFK